MSGRVALFDRIDWTSIWWALLYAARGREVLYFDQTQVGRMLASGLAALSLSRLSFKRIEYQVADHKGLYAEATQLAVAMTEKWFRLAEASVRQSVFDFRGQPLRTKAYVKKAMLLRLRILVLRLLLFERLAGGLGQDAVFVTDGSPTTRWMMEEFQRITGRTPHTTIRPSVPSRLGTVATLIGYYLALLRFVARRGVQTRRLREEFLLAKPAKWPLGRRRSDDFLVDGETILPSDLLIIYSPRTTKVVVRKSVETAREIGYSPVASDGISVQLGWLASRDTLNVYVLEPLLQVFRHLFKPRHELSSGLAQTMLRLRRHTLVWDVLFQRYHVRCLLDDSGVEDQAAATISIHSSGGISASVQNSENLDEFNPLLYYITCHLLFTWGHGMADLRGDSWCVDEVIPIGYLWGVPLQETARERERTRAKYGVSADGRMIAAFDTSLSRDGRNTPSTLRRFYDVLESLADTLIDATIVVKPKTIRTPISNTGMDRRRVSGSRVIFADPVSVDTNQLIGAADLVINMGQSTTLVEGILSGVPSLSLDNTGRDWHRSLSRPEALVFDNGEELCTAAVNILEKGIDDATWSEIQARVKWNYGEVDGQAVERIRSKILEACGSARSPARIPIRVATM